MSDGSWAFAFLLIKSLLFAFSFSKFHPSNHYCLSAKTRYRRYGDCFAFLQLAAAHHLE
jgi:hypothetical protein